MRFTCCPLLHCGRGRDSPTSSWPADRMGGGGVHGEAVVMTTTTASTASLRRTWLRRGGAETVYLLTSLPVAIVSFTVLVTGLSLAGGLMITLVGLPILLLALYAARGFAAVERTRLTWVAGAAATTPRYRGRSGQGAKAWLRLLADRQAWLDVAHALLVFPLAIFTWSLPSRGGRSCCSACPGRCSATRSTAPTVPTARTSRSCWASTATRTARCSTSGWGCSA